LEAILNPGFVIRIKTTVILEDSDTNNNRSVFLKILKDCG
jgi:hypothetical protein